MIYEDTEKYLVWLDSVMEGRPRKELEQLPRTAHIFSRAGAFDKEGSSISSDKKRHCRISTESSRLGSWIGSWMKSRTELRTDSEAGSRSCPRDGSYVASRKKNCK